MLVFLLTSMSARGFNVDGWVHDLSHHGQKDIAGPGSEQADRPEASGKSSPGSLDEVEHQLFHASCNIYLLASSVASFSWGVSPQILVSPSHDVSVPLADLEPPFRPPRSSAFI